MGGGGYLNLLFVGAQDLFLNGQPEITYWKQTWRRYTNHAIESVPVQFSGDVNFGRKFTCLLPKSADLINKMVLQVTVPALAPSGTLLPGAAVRWVDKLGHALIKSVSVQVNGQLIDSHTGEWMELYSSLTLPAEKHTAYHRMIGHVTSLHTDATAQQYTMFIPLRFWFCEATGLSLPTMAMQYAETKMVIEFRSLADLTIQANVTDAYKGDLVSATLYCDCVWLDQAERQRFLDGTHEYLITQVQQATEPVTQDVTSIRVPFSHPVKFLVLVAQQDAFVAQNVNQYFNYTTTLQSRAGANFTSPVDVLDATATGPITSMTLLLNSKERWAARPGQYFNWVQAYQWFDTAPSSPGIYPYSFAVLPTDPAQPSGSLNFSRVTTAVMNVSYDPALFLTAAGAVATATVQLYGVNLNVFKVQKGLASLCFSS